MALIDPTRIFNNLIVLGVLAWVFIMIYSKLDKERVRATMEAIKNMFGSKEEK